jgi:hypothetical protein
MWNDDICANPIGIETVKFGACENFKLLYDFYRDVQTGKIANFRGWMQPENGIPF